MNLGNPDCKDCKFFGMPCSKHCLSTVHCPCGHRAKAEGVDTARVLWYSACTACGGLCNFHRRDGGHHSGMMDRVCREEACEGCRIERAARALGDE